MVENRESVKGKDECISTRAIYSITSTDLGVCSQALVPIAASPIDLCIFLCWIKPLWG